MLMEEVVTIKTQDRGLAPEGIGVPSSVIVTDQRVLFCCRQVFV
jgi:hypothetical protein